MEERDEVSRLWFDASRVKIDMVDAVSVFFDEEALIALSGAPSDSTVTVTKVVSAAGDFEAIRLHVHHPCVFSMARFIRLTADGEWVIENAKFRIRHDYAGRKLAARSLAIQARAAQELGFRRIVLDAIGDHFLAQLRHPEDRWIGYWLWPRLGFDAKLPAGAEQRLPYHFQGCQRVSELVSSEEGADAWLLHGESLLGATFDLTVGSVSWQLLAKYLQQHNIKV